MIGQKMFNLSSYKSMIAAVALAVSAFTTSNAEAATINGAIDIAGQVTVASTRNLNGVDFVGNGFVVATAGDFASIVGGTLVTLTDILFASPGNIWSVGGFTFTANSFFDIALNNQGGKDFTAAGVITGAGFDPTAGTFLFSSNSTRAIASFSASSISEASPVPLPAGLVLLLTGLAGFGAVRKVRSA